MEGKQGSNVGRGSDVCKGSVSKTTVVPIKGCSCRPDHIA